jgi:hypothetical protein
MFQLLPNNYLTIPDGIWQIFDYGLSIAFIQNKPLSAISICIMYRFWNIVFPPYKLYSKGNKPVGVAILLDLSEKKATRYYKEYSELEGLYELTLL